MTYRITLVKPCEKFFEIFCKVFSVWSVTINRTKKGGRKYGKESKEKCGVNVNHSISGRLIGYTYKYYIIYFFIEYLIEWEV